MIGVLVLLGAVPLALYAALQLLPDARWLAGAGAALAVGLVLGGRSALVPGSGSGLADAAAGAILGVLGWALALGLAARALVLLARRRGWSGRVRTGIVGTGAAAVLLPLGLVAKGA